MKKVFLLLLVFLILGGGAYLIYDRIVTRHRSKDMAVLSVNTPYADAGVFIEDKYLGPTPYFSDSLTPGDVSLRVGDYVGKVTLIPGALTVVNQDLGPAGFTGGEVIWLTESQGEKSLAMISSIEGATVMVDGGKVGETPLRLSDLAEGEHTLLVSKEDYLQREVKVTLQPDYKLNVSIELMRNPLPKDVKKMDFPGEKLTVYDLTTDQEGLSSDLSAWLKGLVFFFKSTGFESEFKPDYYLASDGALYTSKGEVLVPENYPKNTSALLVVVYFGEKAPEGVSETAGAVLAAITPTVSSSPSPEVGGESTPKEKVTILETGTGWLRVRSGPNLGSDEVQRVNVGEEFFVVEEQNGWLKITLNDGTEGWIASQFVKRE